MKNIQGFISSELRFPTESSLKKKRYVTFVCTTCSTASEKVYDSSFNNLCTHCAKGGFSTKDFISIGRKNFGDTYQYTNTVYINKRSQVLIECKKHGEFSQRAQEHLAGHGCNKCKFEMKSILQKYDSSVWINRLKKFPNIAFKDINELNGYHDEVTLLCKLHGEFKTQLGAIQHGKFICKECAYSAHQTQSVRHEHIGKMATLYYVYLPNIDMYKFGVTLDLPARLKTLGETVLLATGVKEYSEACALEHLVHTTLDPYRYKGRKVLVKNGSTE